MQQKLTGRIRLNEYFFFTSIQLKVSRCQFFIARKTSANSLQVCTFLMAVTLLYTKGVETLEVFDTRPEDNKYRKNEYVDSRQIETSLVLVTTEGNTY